MLMELCMGKNVWQKCWLKHCVKGCMLYVIFN